MTHRRVLAELVRGPEGNGPLRPLDEERRGLAFDMLGLTPVQRLVRTPLDPLAGGAAPSDAEVAAHQARFIDDQMACLERFKTEELAEVDQIDRAANVKGRETRVDPEIRMIRRYSKDAQRAMDKAEAELLRLQALAAEEARFAAETARISPRRRAADIDPSLLRMPPRPVTQPDAQVPATETPAAAPAAPAPASGPPTPMPPPAVASQFETLSVVPGAAAGNEGHADFTAALREVFPMERPRRRREAPTEVRPARAAHRGFPA